MNQKIRPTCALDPRMQTTGGGHAVLQAQLTSTRIGATTTSFHLTASWLSDPLSSFAVSNVSFLVIPFDALSLSTPVALSVLVSCMIENRAYYAVMGPECGCWQVKQNWFWVDARVCSPGMAAR